MPSDVTDLVQRQPAGMLAVPSPMQAVELVKERYAAIRKIKDDLMQPGVHYGHVGLTGDPKKDKDKKPALFQPGAQVLAAVFGLEPEENLESYIERWDDPDEVFIYYRFKFNMRLNGRVVGTGQGSCNSKEVKYRYRDSSRKCPECGAEAIKKSKFPDKNTGRMEWYCYSKIGGCGAKFDEADAEIVDQVVGKRINPDIGEQANPILKMAHKRGFIAAVLMATMASEFFAQDPEFDHDLKGKPGATEEAPPWESPDEPTTKEEFDRTKAGLAAAGAHVHGSDDIDTGNPELNSLRAQCADQKKFMDICAKFKGAFYALDNDGLSKEYYKILKETHGVVDKDVMRSLGVGRRRDIVSDLYKRGQELIAKKMDADAEENADREAVSAA